MKSQWKGVMLLSGALVLCAGGASAQSSIDFVSPDDPDKVAVGVPQPATITISCVDDLVVTPFTCNTGLGPYPTEYQNYIDPDTWEYFRGSCTPGETVNVDVYRMNSAMDPAAWICAGDFCGVSNTGWDFFVCPSGSTYVAGSDDQIGPLCAGGSYSDPSMTFTCPAEGVFTLAVVDYIGDGPSPEFEVHAAGVATTGVPTTTTVGLVVAAVLILTGLGAAALRLRQG